MKKLLAIILALACCLSLMACSTGETIPETTESSQTQQSSKPSADSATQETNNHTSQTQPVVTQPQQNMCYWCGEMPVGDFETYCVNCRCLKCDKLRKDGGGKYVYCRDHNCNESLCEYPAFEDSQYALSISVVNPTATIADGPDQNTAHAINDYTRQGARLSAVY